MNADVKKDIGEVLAAKKIHVVTPKHISSYTSAQNQASNKSKADVLQQEAGHIHRSNDCAHSRQGMACTRKIQETQCLASSFLHVGNTFSPTSKHVQEQSQNHLLTTTYTRTSSLSKQHNLFIDPESLSLRPRGLKIVSLLYNFGLLKNADLENGDS